MCMLKDLDNKLKGFFKNLNYLFFLKMKNLKFKKKCEYWINIINELIN